jgi:hypothetical protein
MYITDFEKDVFEAIAKLSVPIPDEIVKKEWEIFKHSYRIDGFKLTVETDFGKRTTIAYAVKKEDMFLEIMCELLQSIALKLELHNREHEESKWRYVRSKAVDGHWTYIENQNYLYDSIYDFRKFYFEHHIKFISEIFSVKKAEKLIKTYSQFINKWFIVEHWRFNKDTLEFDEISNSKEVDEKGIEHPRENEIIKK